MISLRGHLSSGTEFVLRVDVASDVDHFHILLNDSSQIAI